MIEKKILATMAFLDITQGELAKECGITPVAISSILHPKMDENNVAIRKSDIFKGILLVAALKRKGADLNEIFDNE